MMCLVPLQFSWAAVASICQHETGSAAQHLGHHEHEHHAAEPDGASNGFGVDADCSACHCHGPAALMLPAGVVHQPAPEQPDDHYQRAVPDPEPDVLFRPPLTSLA
jgi:hypothetical protein